MAAVDLDSGLLDLSHLESDLLHAPIPDPIEFVLSPKFCRKNLYPRQATLLKILFLRDDLFTEYDHEVIGQWSEGFALPPEEKWQLDEPIHWEGYRGIQPDIYERIEICKAEGRKWFWETLFVGGRRSGKGYIGGLAGAYVLWHYLQLGDPQRHYQIDPDKQLACFVYAGKKDQAKANQWRDLINVILWAPCYQRYISRPQAEKLSIYTEADLSRLERLKLRGRKMDLDLATFIIEPKESTMMSGRGPASFMQYYDEMAHVEATGANRSAEELYGAATPALDQFGMDGFIYAGSSPWQQQGQFYQNYLHALEVDQDTLNPIYPEKLMVQLESWDIYEDWEIAHKIPLVPPDYAAEREFFRVKVGGREVPRCGRRITKPVQVYDDRMKRLERANPEVFAVERRARWATSMDAYLRPDKVDAMFEPFVIITEDEPNPEPRHLHMQQAGKLTIDYAAHGDPSKSGANFGYAIGHAEGPDRNGLYHVIFDKIDHWEPSMFTDGVVDYLAITEEIIRDIRNFMPGLLTFDQFNSIMMMQKLREATHALPKGVTITERTATAPLNWAVAEATKTALNLGLVHAPIYEQAELEFKFLQDKGNKVVAPEMGPIQTKDVFDAMSNVIFALIGSQMAQFMRKELQELTIGLSQKRGMMLTPTKVAMEQQTGGVAEQFSMASKGAAEAYMGGNRAMPHRGRR